MKETRAINRSGRSTGYVSVRDLALLMLSALLLGGCSSSDDNNGNSGTSNTPVMVTVNTLLSGSEQVPAVSEEAARGIGRLELNTVTGQLDGSVSVSGLSGPATIAHLHRGFAGSTGPAVEELISNSDGSEWFFPQDFKLEASELAEISAGEYYLNVHTAKNPNGEVRGQIVFGDVRVIRSTLSGENVVPEVSTAATASAVTTVNSRSGDVTAAVFTTGLAGASMANLHEGLAGANGDKVLPLEQDTGNPDIWRTAPGARLDSGALAALAIEGLYYSIETTGFPDGELRGQIVNSPAGATRFTVTIENVSTELTLPLSTGSEAVPLSPGAYIVHQQANNPLVLPLDMASPALESLAEDGDPSQFPDAVPGSVIFNTPVGSAQPGLIFSGDAYSFSISGSPGDKLSFVTMFVESNDWFYTTDDEDNSISLFDDSGNPVLGDVSGQVALWESGTEVDETPGEGPNQAGQGAAPNTGDTESTGVGSLASKNIMPVINEQVLKVTLSLE